MTEYERTFLVKEIPVDLANLPFIATRDVYFPAEAEHPALRLRKQGDKMELTKKQPVADSASVQTEETIVLSQGEYDALTKLPGKAVAKRRYLVELAGREAEIDVFIDALDGLVTVDFEFEAEAEARAFEMPDFCSADISEADWVAGGMIAGKSYADIEPELERLGYQKPAISA